MMIRKVINQMHEQRVAASLGVGDGVGEEPPPSSEPRTPTQTQVYRRPVTPPPDRLEVVLERTSPKEELGLGIGLDDGHVFIYELHSVAAKNEKLRVNDRILAINGTPVSSDSDHRHFFRLLRCSSPNLVFSESTRASTRGSRDSIVSIFTFDYAFVGNPVTVCIDSTRDRNRTLELNFLRHLSGTGSRVQVRGTRTRMAAASTLGILSRNQMWAY